MSVAALMHEAERLVGRANLSTEARADVLTVLRENRSDMLAFVLAVGLEAKISPASALRRAAGIFFNITALQVADDIADGDCHYLDHPGGTGTAAQFILQNLFYRTLLEDDLPIGALARVADAMITGAAPQSFEVRGFNDWSLARAKATAEGFGGAHHGAYFEIMWSGSASAPSAFGVGWGLGIGVSVTSDIRSKDPRFYSLTVDDRVRLIDWTLGELESARAMDLRSVQRALSVIETELIAELGRCGEQDEIVNRPVE